MHMHMHTHTHTHTHAHTHACTLESEWQALPVQSFQADDYHYGTNVGKVALYLSTADTFTYKTRETHNTMLIHACHNYPWYV